jgi:two-component system phosphate regulon sensor histidine kinase PhoR
MISALSRFIFLICVVLIVAFIILFNWGAQWAIFASVSLISIPLVYSYINLARLQNAIQLNSVEMMSLPSGFWEEVLFRLQRLVKSLKQRMRIIEQQHDRFIEAFQASPNGILMLDENDQIEWCNAIAELFFGLSFKRDALQRINFLIRRPEFIQYINKRNFEEPLLLERISQTVSYVKRCAECITAG